MPPISRAEEKKAVVLCGGLGTRLYPLTKSVPKPLIKVAGRCLLDYHLSSLRQAGVTSVYLNLHSFPEQMLSFVGDGSRWGLTVVYALEAQPLGTAGALRLFAPLLDAPFYVLYSDVFNTLDLNALWGAHKTTGTLVTAVVRRTDHPRDSDLVTIDDEGRVVRFYPKGHGELPQDYWGVAACYVMNPEAVAMLPPFYPADIVRDFLMHIWRNNIPIHAYKTDCYMSDIGTTRRLQQVEQDIIERKISLV